MTHWYVQHDSFFCAPWLIHLCNMTDSFAWHHSELCGSHFKVTQMRQYLEEEIQGAAEVGALVYWLEICMPKFSESLHGFVNIFKFMNFCNAYYIRKYLNVYACVMCVHTYICIHIYVYVCIYMNACIHVYDVNASVRLRVCAWVCESVCSLRRACVFACLHSYSFMWVCVRASCVCIAIGFSTKRKGDKTWGLDNTRAVLKPRFEQYLLTHCKLPGKDRQQRNDGAKHHLEADESGIVVLPSPR